MKKPIDILLIGALVAVVVGGATILWRLQQPMPDAVGDGEPLSDVASAPGGGVAGEFPASAPSVAVTRPDPALGASSVPAYPIDQVTSDLPVATEAETPISTVEDRLKAGLLDIVGKKAFLTFLQTDGIVRRVVATVDNLPRSHATARLWPVNPVVGKFSTTATTEGTTGTISPTNNARYAAFVKFAESVDAGHTVKLYKKFYPAFQAAYAELGYPKQYFNDRVIEVIDHLLATPIPDSAPEVQQTIVKGPIPASQPWAHYVYVDPALEGLSAGQKILLRVGPEHAKRLKVKLQDFRSRLGRLSKSQGRAADG